MLPLKTTLGRPRKMEKSTTVLSVTIARETSETLDAIAENLGCVKSDVVRRAVDDLIAQARAEGLVPETVVPPQAVEASSVKRGRKPAKA